MMALEPGDLVEGFQLAAIEPRGDGMTRYRFRGENASFSIEWPSRAAPATRDDLRFVVHAHSRTLARRAGAGPLTLG
jgi:hypothetical protein